MVSVSHPLSTVTLSLCHLLSALLSLFVVTLHSRYLCFCLSASCPHSLSLSITLSLLLLWHSWILSLPSHFNPVTLSYSLVPSLFLSSSLSICHFFSLSRHIPSFFLMFFLRFLFIYFSFPVLFLRLSLPPSCLLPVTLTSVHQVLSYFITPSVTLPLTLFVYLFHSVFSLSLF